MKRKRITVWTVILGCDAGPVASHKRASGQCCIAETNRDDEERVGVVIRYVHVCACTAKGIAQL